MGDIIVSGDIPVDFLLVIEVVGEGRMDLRCREMRQGSQHFVDRKSHLIIGSDGPNWSASARHDRDSIQNSALSGDMWILRNFRFGSCPRHEQMSHWTLTDVKVLRWLMPDRLKAELRTTSLLKDGAVAAGAIA
jgi:hypothetical protein